MDEDSDEESQSEKASSESESSDSSDSDSGSDSSSSSSGSDSDSDSDSDSSSSGSSDSSSSSSSSEEKSYQTGSDDTDEEVDDDTQRERKMLRWLITDEKKKKMAEKVKDIKKDADRPAKPTTKKKIKGDYDRGETRKGDEPEEYSPESLMKKVTDIAQQRGRRGFDRTQYLDKLSSLLPHAAKEGHRATLNIMSSMVSADFDNTGGAFAPMRIDMWNVAIDRVNNMLPILIEAYDDESGKGIDEDPEDPRSYPRQQELFVAFVEKLDDELYKALQFTVDVYGADYHEILGNSSKFLILLRRVIKFFERTKQTRSLGSLSMRLIEQLYYKSDKLNAHVFGAIQHQVPDEEKEDWTWPTNSTSFMQTLCRNVFATDDVSIIRRAILCQVYHLALHDHFQSARDLMHLGNLTEQAESSDVRVQILNNRVVAQMGLCAFRLGKIHEAHHCLMVVYMHNKARELLAQGLSYSKNMERTPEQERAERLRQLPYHMHINLDVLESAHHICAMLLEVPNLAMQTIDSTAKPRIISRVLRRALDQHDKLLFIGPPENPRESVVSAAKLLQCGDWQGAYDALKDLKFWDQIDPGNPEAGRRVKEMVKEKIKTEALRTYVFAYSSIYDAFHQDQLVDMFDLSPLAVHSVISKMMIKEEITAFWDESSKFVLMQHSEPTPLQRLALTLADKGAQAVEINERLFDQKAGGYGFKQQGQQQQGRWDQNGGNAGDRRQMGKGGQYRNEKGSKGKGRGKSTGNQRPQNRGWDNARSSLRGTVQRGWSRPA
eukprot:TRINITY_DN2263_c0_g1_i8.p1 TRINITY_DN2263_c0_g1~~TRINITY_DN2263_c0_g1_i8.p1  ORF type:complete len:807 (-),score=188.04 TRINITY_DN2263_c0_g1_i8:211-2535(-)